MAFADVITDLVGFPKQQQFASYELQVGQPTLVSDICVSMTDISAKQ